MSKATADDEEPIDFLGSRPNATVETVRQLIEAENVLASYSHSIDLLAEAIQNALDAIDIRSEIEPDAPRRLEILFDTKDRRFVVTDTGTGLSRKSLGMVLTPNVTLKQGGLARPRRGRSRGEKGVGLTFLVLASDNFAMQTCNGKERWDLTVADAGKWVRSGGEVPAPKALPKRAEADQLAGSDRYTAVAVSGISSEQFDDDLFDRTPEQLVWDLRTRTAIGNTAVLFEDTGRPQPQPVQITLRYTTLAGKALEPMAVTYGYATPESLVESARTGVEVVDYDEFVAMADEQQVRATRGGALRYVRRWETTTGRQVDMYLFAIDGNEMRGLKEEADAAGAWFPEEWQGMFVATRDMPTGIRLGGGAIPQRTYERRLFVLLQYDELKLDLGRKTLSGRTPAMLKSIVREAWDDELKYVVPRFDRVVTSGRSPSIAALRNKIRAARRAPDLQSDLPYLKQPSNPGGVAAVFHEMLPLNGVVPRLRTLSSAVFSPADALVHRVEDDLEDDDPLHVLFALCPTELLSELEANDTLGTVALGVLWTLDDDQLERSPITVAEIDQPQPDGATHELSLRGLGGRDALRVIVLDQLVSRA